MSRQKKQHMDKRKENAKAQQKSARPKNVVRVHLADGLYIFLTTLILLGAVAAMVGIQLLGWFDTFLGAVPAFLIAALVVLCIFDLAMLITNCITVADGSVNAGKDEQGNLMIFHAENVVRVELRDRSGHTVPENAKRYSRVALTFVMASGRVNQRPYGRIRQKKLDEIREAIKR